MSKLFQEKFEGKSTRMGKEGIKGLLGLNPNSLTKNKVEQQSSTQSSL